MSPAWRVAAVGSWLPAALRGVALAMAIAVFTGVLTLVYVTRWRTASPVALPLLACLSSALHAWWAGLGVPLGVRVGASVEAGGALADVGSFEGVVRVGQCAAAFVCAVPLVLAGGCLARILGARDDAEHAVTGLLLALPMAVVSGAVAAVFPCSVEGLRLHDVTLDARLAASPIAVACVMFCLALLAGTVGAMLRQLVRVWRHGGRALIPRYLSIGAAVLCGLVVAVTLSTMSSVSALGVRRPPPKGAPEVAAYVGPVQQAALCLGSLPLYIGSWVEVRAALTSPAGPPVALCVPVEIEEKTKVEVGSATAEGAPLSGSGMPCALTLFGASFVAGLALRLLRPDNSGGDVLWCALTCYASIGLVVFWSGGWVSGQLVTAAGGGAVSLWGACVSGLALKLLPFFLAFFMGVTLGSGRSRGGRVW